MGSFWVAVALGVVVAGAGWARDGWRALPANTPAFAGAQQYERPLYSGGGRSVGGPGTSIAFAAQRDDRPVWVREPARPGRVARGEGLLRQAMLVGQNRARAAFGSAPLAWDPRLAEAARGYARELARTDAFRHSTGRPGQGENLWTGTRGAYGYDEMIGAWVAEERAFRAGVVPAVSRTGRFADVGHYVQIVWPATTRVGCATASSRGRDYLVCRYAPAGNVVGQRVG